MPRVEIDGIACKACELCIFACPKNVLALGEKNNPSGYHYAVVVNQEACIACASCARMCPDVVFTVNK